MKKPVLLFALLLLWCPALNAQTASLPPVAFSGQGIGPSRDEAKKEALADLSQAIHVEVASEFSSVVTQTKTSADALKTKRLAISSRLPLLGVTCAAVPAGAEFQATARLTGEALPLYRKELPRVREKIDLALAKADDAETHAEKIVHLQDALTRIDRFERLSLVALLLGETRFPPLGITDAEIKSRIRRLETQADTLDDGLKFMAKGITQKGVYIFPPTTGASREVTPFAGAVKDHLSVYVATCPDLAAAAYIMTGEYTILDDAVELTYRLTDHRQHTLRTTMAWFLPPAYKGYRIKPATLDFERLITSGMVVSSDFHVDIKTADGRCDLLYKKGDKLTLLVKMNRPGYFYLMGHAFKDQDYTYLVQLSEAPGNRKFIAYVGPDEAGKWMELGEFEAVAPFGVETLQVFAATRDLEEEIPATFCDLITNLYKVGTPETGKALPAETVTATRGLMLKKKKQSAHAEASLTITTMAH